MVDGNTNKENYSLLCFLSRILQFYVMLGLCDLWRKKAGVVSDNLIDILKIFKTEKKVHLSCNVWTLSSKPSGREDILHVDYS